MLLQIDGVKSEKKIGIELLAEKTIENRNKEKKTD